MVNSAGKIENQNKKDNFALMIFKKKHIETGSSLNALAWKRFKSNKLSVFGLITILLALLIGILGYLVTPDKTPFANNQMLEITTQKPGFKCTFLKIRKNEQRESCSALQ